MEKTMPLDVWFRIFLVYCLFFWVKQWTIFSVTVAVPVPAPLPGAYASAAAARSGLLSPVLNRCALLSFGGLALVLRELLQMLDSILLDGCTIAILSTPMDTWAISNHLQLINPDEISNHVCLGYVQLQLLNFWCWHCIYCWILPHWPPPGLCHCMPYGVPSLHPLHQIILFSFWIFIKLKD